MTLQNYLNRYNLARDIKPSTLEHYQWVVRSLDSFTGRPTLLAELSPDLINGYLLWLRDRGRSPFTCKQRRASILVLWRAAADENLATPPIARQLRQVRTPDPPRPTWLPAEVARLIDAAAVLGGSFRTLPGINRAAYFRTLIAAAYDSGLRRSDLHALPISSTGQLTAVRQLKTGRAVVVRLRPETERAVACFVAGTDRPLIWPLWSQYRTVFARQFQQIVAAAGLTGTFSQLRKTSGTEVERLRPGSAWLHLGHSSPDTARQWYINQARAYTDTVPLPPELPYAQLPADRHQTQQASTQPH